MFNKLKDFFESEEVENLEVATNSSVNPEELKIATGVLLLETAGSDGDYDPEETKTIFAALEATFNISNSDAYEILKKSNASRENKGNKIDYFIKMINQHYSEDQKIQILSMAWTVILSDGKIEKHEQKYITQLKFRLQLNDEQAERARLAAVHN